MARDLLGRAPLRASELPPGQVRLYPGEAWAVVCPGCRRWQVPHDGGLRHHTVGIDSMTTCLEVGRRVWFDLTPAQWAARLEVAVRDAQSRHGSRARHRDAHPPVMPPLFRIAAARRHP
jgi:hypothetical protein